MGNGTPPGAGAIYASKRAKSCRPKPCPECQMHAPCMTMGRVARPQPYREVPADFCNVSPRCSQFVLGGLLEGGDNLLLAGEHAGKDHGVVCGNGGLPCPFHDALSAGRSSDEGRGLLQDVHNEKEHVVDALLLDKLLLRINKGGLLGQWRCGLCGLQYRNTKLLAANLEDLGIHHDELIRRHVVHLGFGIKHRLCECVHVEAGERAELGGVDLVQRRGRRRPELKGVGQDTREHKAGDRFRNFQAHRLGAGVQDARGRTERSHVDLQWLRIREAAEFVVVDDGVDWRLGDAIGELRGVVRVNDGHCCLGLERCEQRRQLHVEGLEHERGLWVQLTQTIGARRDVALVELPRVDQRRGHSVRVGNLMAENGDRWASAGEGGKDEQE
mmetsp:Transcript_7772/g.19198  ORF Transcript_7772/g.19198 Transcript_7772/m.19198 type:complete len:386 (+) Transcript_7772:64-1221(+)